MSTDTSNMALGAVVLIVAVPLIYFAARAISRAGDRLSAHMLQPIAAAVSGTVHVDPPHIAARHDGRDIRMSSAPGSAAGEGEGADTVNEFIVAVSGVQGRHSWAFRFHVTGLFGQGPKELLIEVADPALGDRLIEAGALAQATTFFAATAVYKAVAYDARSKVLTCTDDVKPRKLPSPRRAQDQMALAVALASINERVDSA